MFGCGGGGGGNGDWRQGCGDGALGGEVGWAGDGEILGCGCAHGVGGEFTCWGGGETLGWAGGHGGGKFACWGAGEGCRNDKGSGRGVGSTNTHIFLIIGGGAGSFSILSTTFGGGFLGCSITLSIICCGWRVTLTLSITSPCGVGFLFTHRFMIGSGVGSRTLSTFFLGGETLQSLPGHAGCNCGCCWGGGDDGGPANWGNGLTGFGDTFPQDILILI